MNNAQEALLTEAKLILLRRQPYYGVFIIGMPMIENPSIPTAQTNFIDIQFNPNWLLGGGDDGRPLRGRDEVVFVLGHETLHISFKHGFRMGFRDPRLWNISTDHAINLILTEGEVGKYPEFTAPYDIDPKTGKFPPKLLDQRFKDMSAETIYDILEKERQKQGGGDKFKSGNVVIDLSGGGGDPGGMGGFTHPANADGSALSDNQKAELERTIDARTSTAAASAKSQGKLPAGLERFLKTAMKPVVDWREKLRQFVAKMYPSDLSWQRPNRRYIWQDIYLPMTEKAGVGEILVIMDTSGSVDYSSPQSEGAQYFAEITAIYEDVMPSKLHVIYSDAEVAGYDVFEQGEEPVLKPRGGGGTDFRPPFKYALKNNLDIQCAILLTDGYGPFPESPLPFPVLFVITTDVVAPFGETIRIMK